MIKRIGLFITFMCLFAGLAWLAGFNFDKRGIDVAWFTAVFIWVSAFFTLLITDRKMW